LDYTNKEKKTDNKYYLSDVFNKVINFLYYYPNEAVINLKNDNVHLIIKKDG